MNIKKDRNILSISKGAYNHYKSITKNNESLDRYDAMCKITRNYILGTEVRRVSDNDCTRVYGNLIIRVKGGTVVHVRSKRNKTQEYINLREKKTLDKVYRLNKIEVKEEQK